jgi:hypothetical protein
LISAAVSRLAVYESKLGGFVILCDGCEQLYPFTPFAQHDRIAV